MAQGIINSPVTTGFHLYVLRPDKDGDDAQQRVLQILTSTGISDANAAVWYRKHTCSGWSVWRSFATATPPREYDLPLSSGITGTAKYYKTNEGLIVIHGWVLGVSLNTVLATLPEGFRPKYHTIRASICSAAAPSIGLVRLEVSITGEMKVIAWNEVGTMASGVSINMDFISAD